MPAQHSESHQHPKLDELSATAIASNDILSSCLYVSGIAILFAGIWAPLIFVGIAVVLWAYKKVYTEVVEALPLNGGAYNCLLNATDKNRAAIAGVMTVLSYIATSVISAKTAAEYLHTVWHSVPVIPLTSAIIIFFAILTSLGVKDSAKVAKLIFGLNIFTLTLFISLGLLAIANQGWGNLTENLALTNELFSQRPPLELLFFAFSASLLGVSGFESSANFVEEQKPGVFRKTLKNMHLGVAIFNPLIALIVLYSLKMPAIELAKDYVLADAAIAIGGKALLWLVVINAFLVLSGAVLASFVGATGLLYRMTLDHCLPSSLLLPKLNKKRNSNTQRLIMLFGVLCLSILFLTKGNLLSLAGVYTISFLGVMTLFAVGNLILRRNRSDLKRTYHAPLLLVVFAAVATSAGIIGNIMINPQNFMYFLVYFVPALFIVSVQIYRDYILEAFVHGLQKIPILQKLVLPLFEYVIRSRIVLFAHNPQKLYKSLEYIRRNETSRRIAVVYCHSNKEESVEKLHTFEKYVEFFKTANIFPQFQLTFHVEKELSFGKDAIKEYAKRYRIGRNNVFIGSIHHTHAFTFEDLGGVRIIQ